MSTSVPTTPSPVLRYKLDDVTSAVADYDMLEHHEITIILWICGFTTVYLVNYGLSLPCNANNPLLTQKCTDIDLQKDNL